MGQVDKFLMMTVSLALVVGVDRDHQHDADEHHRAVRRVRRLRTNGWSQGNILSLVTLESALPRAAGGPRRLRAGDCRRDAGGQPVHRRRTCT